MGWQFWKRRQNPLDTDSLRRLENRIEAGDLRGVAEDLKKEREVRGESHGLRYLEARVYHDGNAVPPDELLRHLQSVVDDDKIAFPEAKLLEARLTAACGDLDGAKTKLQALGQERMLPALAERVRATVASIDRLCGPEGRRRIEEQAEILVTELRDQGLNLSWTRTDLARIDSFLDEQPEPAHDDRARWTSLIGEIAVRTSKGAWRLTPRAEDRSVRLADNSVWPVGKALRDRLLTGAPLYESLHRALGTPFRPLAGMPGVDILAEPSAHPTVVADHVARSLLRAGARGLGVFRVRPTPEGAVYLPVSFIDKSESLRVVYVETRAWDPATLANLRRWTWRLRMSAARAAEISLVSAHQPPKEAIDLIEGRAEAPPPIVGILDTRRDGSGSATPRSLDEPKLRWLDDKAEVMERVVRASLNTADPSDLEILKKAQTTVAAGFANRSQEMAPKQWNALYGYGALFGRILARSLNARWSGLADDTQPTHWQMVLPDGRSARPIGLVVRLARLGPQEGDLVSEYMDLRTADRSPDLDRDS